MRESVLETAAEPDLLNNKNVFSFSTFSGGAPKGINELMDGS